MAIVYGTSASETINGSDGVTNGFDVIYGYGGNDSIYGLGGDDALIGGLGADYLNGGSGIDWAYYDDSTAGVVVSLASGMGANGYADGDQLVSIESLYGSNYDDLFVGNSGSNTLRGVYGNDVLKGGGGDDSLDGGNGNDSLNGGDGADVLYGGSGIDTAVYNESDVGVTVALINNSASGGDAQGDTLVAIENLTGSNYADQLWGDNAANALNGGNGNDILKGYGGADVLDGGSGNDTLWGMDGDDILDGDLGNDTMNGGLGNDNYYVDGADSITELAGQGTDKVFASVGHTLAANVENLELTAAAGATFGAGNALGNQIVGNNFANTLNGLGGNDVVSGGGGADLIYGEAGDDILLGGSGDDILIGGADIDGLTGGTGNDTFFFALGDGGNYVTDFVAGDSSGDVISLQGWGWDSFDDVVMSVSGVSDVSIYLDDNNQILLQNVNIANLNAGDFLFS